MTLEEHSYLEDMQRIIKLYKDLDNLLVDTRQPGAKILVGARPDNPYFVTILKEEHKEELVKMLKGFAKEYRKEIDEFKVPPPEELDR